MMKSFRFYLIIASAVCVLALLMGCASPLQKADKLAVSDPRAAISAYEQVMKAKPGSEEARLAHLGIAKVYYERLEDKEKGLEVYEEIVKAYPNTPVSGKANYAIAWHYYEAQDYEKAREKFAIVTREIPGTDEADGAALAIAKCYEELKKYEEAAKLYEEFSKSHPQHRHAGTAGLSAAKSYEKAGKVDEAIDAYKHVATEYALASSGKEARDALTNMGVEVADLTELIEEEAQGTQPQGQPEEVSQFGATRRRRATNVPRPEIGSIRRDEEQGQPQSTRSVSPDFGVDPYELMPIVNVDSQGTMYDAMFMFANMNLQSGEYKNAGALYEKAIELAGSRSWDNAANAYFGLAKSYRGIGMEDKATEMFKEAIKHDRKVIDRMIISGETQYGEEEYEEALRTYKTALGLVPHKDHEIYYNMGLVYRKMKDADKELEAFERAVALKPTFIDAVQHVAEVLYYRKKEPVRADLYDKEVRGLGNTDYSIQKEIGSLCYKYGRIFSKEEDREKQSDLCYSWSKIRYSNSERLLRSKIEVELKKAIDAGDESEAKQLMAGADKVTLKLVSDAAASGNELASKALEKVAPLLDEYRLIGSRIVICNVRMNRLKQAQEQLDEMKGIDPNVADSAEFHLALGEFALVQGDKDAGVAEIRKALEIDPKHEEAAERLKEIEGQKVASSG